MRIGIDARLYGIAGPGRYITNLIRELENLDNKNDYIIFVSKDGSELYHPKSPKFKKWIADYKLYSIQEQTFFLKDLIQAKLDLLHVPHFNIPILYPRKMVVTIHDLIMHDFNSPEATTLPKPEFFLKQIAYRIVTNIASIRPCRVIVPTETVKSEVINKLKYIKSDKITVTYEGVDNTLLKLSPIDNKSVQIRLEEMLIRDRYFLYVGSAYPHKNLNLLMISYKDLLEKLGVSAQMVIAGRIDKFSERLAGFSHALQLNGKVVYAARYSELGFVSEQDLANLYKTAMAYVFPSLTEGFSITPLEAQAFGTPVLLSNIPTHKEIFQDSALYFDPESAIDLSEKMAKIATDKVLRNELISKGYKNVKKYSWKSMAEKTLQVYQVVV